MPRRATWTMAAVSLVVHLIPRPGYGFHRDELLYLAMADHLHLLRMQFPPMIALLGRLAQALPLPTLGSVHLLAALAGAGVVVATGSLARRMGGDHRAELLATLAVLVSPLSLRSGALFQPVVFEILWWAVAALAFASLLDGGDRRWWLVFGAAAGFGGLTKFSAAIFGVAMAVGVLVSPLRRDFGTRWPWSAAALGALLALPSVLGQITWGWPFFVQARVLRASQFSHVTLWSFLSGQLFIAGAAAPVLVAGAVALFAAPGLRRFRALGVAVAAACAFLLWMGGKEYYLGPMHPVLLAAGAVWTARKVAGRSALRRGTVGFLVLGGLVLFPIGVPVLPPALMARYSAALGMTRAVTTNQGTTLPLPQDYADMLGWREQVAAVARVYHELPDSERAGAIIVGGNYGRAGALAVYHEEFGLPYPVSRHGDFWAWGYGNPDPTVVIILGGTVPELQEVFEDVADAGVVSRPLGVEEEQHVHILVCRHPKTPLPELWRELGVVWG